MAAVFAGEERVAEAIEPHAGEIAVAALNGPRHTVISGRRALVRKVGAELEAEGIRVRSLEVSHAFHSPLMEPVLAAFEEVAREVEYSPPRLGLISNVSGGWAGSEVATPEYWTRHVRQPVRFAAGMAALLERGYETFVEIGPHPTLLGMARQGRPDEQGAWLPSLRRAS